MRKFVISDKIRIQADEGRTPTYKSNQHLIRVYKNYGYLIKLMPTKIIDVYHKSNLYLHNIH